MPDNIGDELLLQWHEVMSGQGFLGRRQDAYGIATVYVQSPQGGQPQPAVRVDNFGMCRLFLTCFLGRGTDILTFVPNPTII